MFVLDTEWVAAFSWKSGVLNLVELWFRELTDNRIRRGVFKSVPELLASINEYLAAYNENATAFEWTASADAILSKVSKCKSVLETVH